MDLANFSDFLLWVSEGKSALKDCSLRVDSSSKLLE